RGHSAECSRDALARLAKSAPQVEVAVHLIFGTPVDPIEIARKTAENLNHFGVAGVKLHQLMVLENSDLATRFRREPFTLPSLEEYTRQVAEFLNHLAPNVYVERLAATATHPEECLAPEWSRRRWGPHNEMRKTLEALGCRQGRLYLSDSLQ
ncbi:MAG: TIGR01212 family radical SAM protein, partial [Bdellovibrionota bacterium]